jgi:hypothetical protein
MSYYKIYIKYIILKKYFNDAGVPKLGKSNDLKRGQPRDREILIDVLADVLGLVGSSPTPGDIFIC